MEDQASLQPEMQWVLEAPAGTGEEPAGSGAYGQTPEPLPPETESRTGPLSQQRSGLMWGHQARPAEPGGSSPLCDNSVLPQDTAGGMDGPSGLVL